MSFQDDAYSAKAKLHLTQAKTPVLIGLCVVVLVVVVFLAQGLYGVFSADSFEIVKAEAQGASVEEEAGDEASDNEAQAIYVHVAGAVAKPGLYSLSEGSRLFDAVEIAGGFSEGAVSAALNLARVIEDGEQIVVPTVQELEAAPVSSEIQDSAATTQGSSTSSKVNINAANQAELETLPGIGEATAKKIIAFREANGRFAGIENLKEVSGIGDKKYADLSALISV